MTNEPTPVLENFEIDRPFVIIPNDGEFKNLRFRISNLRVEEHSDENGENLLRCNIDHLTAKEGETEEYANKYSEFIMTLLFEYLMKKKKEHEAEEERKNNSGPLP